MKNIFKLSAILLLAVFLLNPLMAQAGGPLSRDEVTEAVGITVGMYFYAAFASAFGSEVENCIIDEDTGSVTFNNASLDEFIDEFDETSYLTINGTGETDGELLYFTVTLTGGPVVTLEFAFPINGDESDLESMEIIANGDLYYIDLEDEM